MAVLKDIHTGDTGDIVSVMVFEFVLSGEWSGSGGHGGHDYLSIRDGCASEI